MRSVIKLNNDLIVFSLTFFLALISIMKIPVLPKIIIQTLKLVAIIFIFLYIFKNPKKVKIHDQFDIIAFGLVVIISSYINYRITPYFFYGVIYAFMLFGIFVILPTAIYNNGIAPVVKVIFICFFTICMVNDFCLGKCIDSNYLIGTKFSVSYWHCILILMYSLSFQIHGVAYKFFLIIFTFWSLIIAFLIKCSTGLIAITLLFILLFFGNILGKFLIKPIPLLATILMIGYSIYLWDIILSSDNVKNFIINVLHESLTLTGRIQIYKMLPKLAQEKPIIGWGYGTEIVRDKLYGNAQNGLWHIGIQYGIVGVLLFIVIILHTFYKRNNEELEYKIPIVFIIYTFIVISCVEVNYGYIFFISLALYRAINNCGSVNRKELIRYGKHIGKSSKNRIRIIA